MKNLLVVLCLVILSLTFGGQCKASTDATPQWYASQSAEGLLSSEKDSERDMGCIEDAFQPRSERTVAVVSDVRNIYRICNSRPQRVITSLTERSVRMSGTFSLFYKYRPLEEALNRKLWRRCTGKNRDMVSQRATICNAVAGI